MKGRVSSILVALAAATLAAAPSTMAPAIGTTPPEAATARRFAAIRRDPLQLRAFLAAMPKGGDLHNHLSGSIYAEDYLAWAAADGLCVTTSTMTITGGACDEGKGQLTAASLVRNAALFNQAIDAMSMRHWDRSTNGHDRFFAAFTKLGPVASKFGEMLAAVTAQAAAEHVSYLELMLTPDDGASGVVAATVTPDADLGRWRDKLLAAGLRDAVVKAAGQRLDAAEARRNELQGCGTPAPQPGCAVTVRYIAQVYRATGAQLVYAQILSGFLLAGADPRVVSLNLVQPEDYPAAIRDFSQQMAMLDFLQRQYPGVPVTLHAGELADGLVPPAALRFHIRQSIEVGHAQRIGHGAALMSEDDPYGLLREMAARKVLVEIALTSNDQILGIRGDRHPLRLYLKYGVPVAIVTDDMGVARSTHTQEFVKAVEEHGLDYPTLKRLVRNSLEYAFVDATTKRALQTALERDLVAFERRQTQS
jgi:hypothetical protein